MNWRSGPPVILATLLRRLRSLFANRAQSAAGGDGMTGEASDTAVAKYRDDEDGYLGWVRDHSDGWVINAGRNLAPSDRLVLHRANCRYITALPPHTKDYIKFCSTDRDALLEWAQRVEWVQSAADTSTGCSCLAWPPRSP